MDIVILVRGHSIKPDDGHEFRTREMARRYRRSKVIPICLCYNSGPAVTSGQPGEVDQNRKGSTLVNERFTRRRESCFRIPTGCAIMP